MAFEASVTWLQPALAYAPRLKLMLQEIWTTHFCMPGTSPVSRVHLPTPRPMNLVPYSHAPLKALLLPPTAPWNHPAVHHLPSQSLAWTLCAPVLVPLSMPVPLLGHPPSSPHCPGSDGSVVVGDTWETLLRAWCVMSACIRCLLSRDAGGYPCSPGNQCPAPSSHCPAGCSMTAGLKSDTSPC